jgi:hypothetical protein
VIAAGTLLGYDDQPAELTGHGPITAQHARELAADPTGTWRRLLTDPATGHLLDAGAHTYRPSMHLIDFLTARDGECVFPTCHQPAHRCHIEHCHPFDAGGPTTLWTHHPTGRSYHSQPRHRWPKPEKPTPESATDRHHREDQHYATHIARLRIQRTHARKTGNRNAHATADRDLKDTHTQRQRELRHRQDPNYPPF